MKTEWIYIEFSHGGLRLKTGSYEIKTKCDYINKLLGPVATLKGKECNETFATNMSTRSLKCF